MANKRRLEVVWDALHEWQDLMDNHDLKDIEERWDDICTAMAWIKEDLEDIQYANKYNMTQTEKETI